MKNQRLQQFILSLSVVLSLFASSVSAAHYCSHHGQTGAENHAASCHQMTMNDAEYVEVSASDEAVSVDVGCHCFVKISPPFVVGKSETVKIQKNLAVLPLVVKTEKTVVVALIAPVKSHFGRHFYNSNYLLKLLPARAPPVS